MVFKLYCAEEFPGCLFKHAGPQATAPEILFGKFGRVWAFVFFQSNPGGSDAGGAQVTLGEILASGYQVSLNEEPPPSQEAWLQLVGFCFSGAIDKEECFRAVSSRTELFFVLAFNGNWRYLFLIFILWRYLFIGWSPRTLF